MRINFGAILIMLIFGNALLAQDWQSTQANLSSEEIRFQVAKGHLALGDFTQISDQLLSLDTRNSHSTIDLPLPEGEVKTFEIKYDPIYGSAFQQKFPSIKTYSIQSGKFHGRMDINEFGIHVMLLSPSGTILIDPAFDGDRNTYLSYYSKDLITENRQPFSCEVADSKEVSDGITDEIIQAPKVMGMRNGGAPVTLRTYRTAVSCTGEYAQFHGGTTQGAMSAIVTTINRVNTIYEIEHAIKLILIDNNDELIFLNPTTDPFTNNSLSNMLDQNLTTINSIIGSGNYDIGHVFGTLGGGLAQLGSVCTNGKARGATGLPNPRGDFFDVVYVGHEVGHQFAANHTFNNCDGNENFGTGYEPGSGTTIMAYAGLCNANNVSNQADFFFHNASLNEVRNFIQTGAGGSCATEIPTDNTDPSVSINVPQNLNIPIGTPFELRGSGSDEEGSPVLLSWEQWDLGPRSSLGEPMGTAPLFRYQVPNASGVRILPNIQRVLSGTQGNDEILPLITRPITFRLTGRDQHPGSGGFSWAQLNIQAVADAGPFVVNSPEAGESLVAGSFYDLTWDVANTNQAPVNCEFVDILMSRNGGSSFTDTLMAQVPNTGSVILPVPTTSGSNRRLKIAARDNVFFQVNPGNFSIVQPDNPTFSFVTDIPRGLICIPSSVNIPLSTLPLRDYEGTVRFEFNPIDFPEEANFSFSEEEVIAGNPSLLTLDFSNYIGMGLVSFEILGISDELGDTLMYPVELFLRNFLSVSPDPISPLNGQEGTSAPIVFSWDEVPGATHYNFYIGTSENFPEYTFSATNIQQTSFTPLVLFQNSEVYFWKVEAENLCGVISEDIPFVFQTEVLSCIDYFKEENEPISATGMPTINSEIAVPIDAELASVEVKNILGNHQSFNDMDFWLFDPSGEGIRLLGRSCSTYGGIFNLSFSDLSAQGFSCPPSQDVTFRPVQPFTVFQGKNALGNWRLRIRDVVSGGGGSFNSWTLNVCVSAPSSRPELIVNDTLFLLPGTGRHLNSSLLQVTDAIKSPEELIYILVTIPQNGELFLPNQQNPLEAGAQFSQADINSGRLLYLHNGSQELLDQFYFIVRHVDGGFIATERFNIATDEDFVSSTTALQEESTFTLFPNPTNQEINITFTKGVTNPIIQIFTNMGQQIGQFRYEGLQEFLRIDTGNLSPGIYHIRVLGVQQSMHKTFIRQ